GDPDLLGQDHRGVDTDHVVAAAHHLLPPLPLDVLLQLHTQRAVVPRGAGTAVDLPRREHEAPALGEADDGIETRRLLGHFIHSWVGGPAPGWSGRAVRTRLPVTHCASAHATSRRRRLGLGLGVGRLTLTPTLVRSENRSHEARAASSGGTG